MNRRIFIQAGLMAGFAGCSAIEDAMLPSSLEDIPDESSSTEGTRGDRTLEAFDELDD